jgi:DNA polymerase-3 subunit delta
LSLRKLAEKESPLQALEEAFFSLVKREVLVIDKVGLLTEELEKYLSSALLLCGRGESIPSSLYKAVEEKGVVFDLPELKPWERAPFVAQWIEERVHEREKKIDYGLAHSIAKEAPYDVQLLIQELEKVCIYAHERSLITAQDIAAVGSFHTPVTTWQFIDSITQAQAKTALTALADLFTQEIHPLVLIKTLRTSIHNLFVMASLVKDGTPIEEIGKKFSQFRGKMFEKNLHFAQQKGTHKLKRALFLINQLEEDCKSGKEPRFTLEMATIRLTEVLQ